MSENIVVRSPTRVDLAGGTLDLWPLYSFIGGATTINIAINLWTSCEIERRSGAAIEVQSDDLKKTWNFGSMAELLRSGDSSLEFYKQLFSSGFENLGGFRLRTSSQSPVGGGIGGSSSLLISCLKALHQFDARPLPEPVALALWAHHIEARMLRTPTGTQDYLPAISGGLNLIHYSDRGLQHEVLDVHGSPLETHFLLVNTGRSHHSGLNNFDVLSRAVAKDTVVFGALKDLKQVAADLVVCIRGKDWGALPQIFQRELEARLKLTPHFSSPEIEKLHDLSLKNGASAMKICGAGGGGCVMIWVEASARERVVSVCQNAGFQVLPAGPVGPLSKPN